MKLFDNFEAVKFPQENMIFITNEGYLYYIYDCQYKSWNKYKNAGNDYVTVSNYDDVDKEELMVAMEGTFPKRETDFMRMCPSSQLWICDMLDLLKEDYAEYMSDHMIYYTVHSFLLESSVCHRAFEAINNLLDAAARDRCNNSLVATRIKEFSFKMIGRDIYKREIGIVDGHDSSSYFWIMPVRIIDYSDITIDGVAEMRSNEISIEENDVDRYLMPFLYKHFDATLEANARRIEYHSEDGEEENTYIGGFEWYLTHNFFTFDSMVRVLADIADTIDALNFGRETEYTDKLNLKKTSDFRWQHRSMDGDDAVADDLVNEFTDANTEVALVVDFYQRFLYRMEYMMKVGEEKGYNLISFMGP